jgi:Fe-S oxidoreductase/nitrate reductase gamma subunit
MAVQREHLFMVPGWDVSLHYVLMALALALTLYGVYRRFSMYGVKLIDLPSTLRGRLGLVLRSEARLLRERYGGLMHTLMVAGLVALFVGTILVGLEHDLLMKVGQRILVGDAYLAFEFALDLAGLLFVVGVLMAIVRRAFFKPDRLENRGEDVAILLLLLYGGLSGFVMEGLRLASPAFSHQPWITASFVGYAFSRALLGLSVEDVYPYVWASHSLAMAIAIPLLVYSKLRHFPLFFLCPTYSLRELKAPFNLDEVLRGRKLDFKVGLESLDALSWGLRLSLDACVKCGRCQDACPAYRANKVLSPREVVRRLGGLMMAGGRGEAGSALREEEVWSCTTCGECVVSCPIFLNPMRYIIEARRHLVTSLGRVPTSALFNIMIRGNPYGLPRSEKRSWMKGLNVDYAKEGEEVEVLLWIGCAGAYDARAQRVVKALTSLLARLNVKFAVLGEEECCGELARRLGDEVLFQEVVKRNAELFKRYSFKALVTLCPHCYNSFKNDYPEFGVRLNVKSHVELMHELAASGRIKVGRALDAVVVYHDPCYLRNYNDVSSEPRGVLRAISGLKLVEAAKHFCCGGGGGGSWIEAEGVRMNVQRLEDLLEAKPDMIVTACPYCIGMFEDALKSKGLEGKLEVKDVCEVLASALG